MSKKVIEPVIIEQSDGSKIEITPYGSDFLLVIQEERPINILNDNRTTVAKAICPEYQKVIDHNKFLEFENARLTKVYQKAFNKTHEVNAHNAKLVEALREIKSIGGFDSTGKIGRAINQALQNNKKIEG